MEYIRPRLRLTNYCNRKCEYCFADDYLQGVEESLHLTLSEVHYVLNNCVESNINKVAWQGGEPLIHPQIVEIINLHKNKKIKVSIFTNGLFNPKIISSFENLDFDMLINLNHPNTYSCNEFDTVLKNIRTLIDMGYKNQISLGYNYYGENPDYSFFLKAIQEFNIRSVRIDMVRPSITETNTHYKATSIGKVFPHLKRMLNECISVGAYFAHFDCPFPLCELSKEDYNYIWRKMPLPQSMGKCYTHIDIQKNMSISSCFCSYKFENIFLNDFSSLNECRSFIKYYEDQLRWDINAREECINCIYKRGKICQGGCLGYSKNQKKLVIGRQELKKYKLAMHKSEENEINLETFAAYELYQTLDYNIQKNGVNKVKEKIEALSSKSCLFPEMNKYYLNLCKGKLLFSEGLYDNSLHFYKEAYKNAHYTDIKFIINQICLIDQIMKKETAII